MASRGTRTGAALHGDRACPLLVLWGANGKIGQWYEPLALWRQYASGDVNGGAVDSLHYLAEEASDEVLRKLDAFLVRPSGGRGSR